MTKKRPAGSSIKAWLDQSGLSETLQEVASRMVRSAIDALNQEEEELAPDPKSPYGVLGLLPEAPLEVVEAAYRALAKKHHPDQGGDAEDFRRVTEAYQAIRRGD